ncbi:MAG: hypothetical protein MJZ57_03130 [Bacteroidales bacterium]|nr:hypothetical protein [Bacteroidales bacterium]
MENTDKFDASHLSWEELKNIIYAFSDELKESHRQLEEEKKIREEEYRKLQEETRKIIEEERKQREEERKQREEEHKRREEELQRREEERQRREEELQRREEELQRREEERIARQEERQREREVQEEKYRKTKAEEDRKLQEQMKETDRKFKELATRFTSQSGHIVEGLMEPSALRLFQQYGFDITKCWKEMKGHNKTLDRKMEVDLFYYDTTDAIAVEVKINCTKADIDHFLSQMEHFKEIFWRFADVNVYVAIAAINFDRDADRYAAEKGLFVIRVADYDLFSLDPADKEKMRKF